MTTKELLAKLREWGKEVHHCLHHSKSANKFRPGSADYICCQCGAEDPTDSRCSEHIAHAVLPLAEALAEIVEQTQAVPLSKQRLALARLAERMEVQT